MNIDPNREYLTAKDLLILARKGGQLRSKCNWRQQVCEYAAKNGYSKTRLMIGGVRRIYYYKPESISPSKEIK